MSRRPNSFARALKDAEKRLEKALAERKEALERVAELTIEIPNLEKTISALRQQMNPNVIVPDPIQPSALHVSSGALEELGKYVGPQDLTGMGSIPALTEDDTLPEPEGTPLTED